MFRNFKLRSLSFALLIISVLVLSAVLKVAPAYAISTPWLTTSGRYINDPSGNHVILRGVNIIDIAAADATNRSAVARIDMATDSTNGWYARVIRLPIIPASWDAGPDAYFNNHLSPAVQECVARQIYCIVDFALISDYNTSAADTDVRNFWNYMAPKYANTPNIIYEVFNEPINPDDWNTWKATAQPWVTLIRSLAPKNLILVGGPRWSQNVAGAATNPFTGGNIAYVCHVYPQHGGQSTWDSWFGNSSSSAPYFITEWGWQNGGNTPTSGTLSGYGTPFSNYLDSKGVSWTAWVFDTSWQPKMFDTSWNLLGGENYMGQFTKDFLNLHRNDNLPGGGTVATNTPIRTATSGPTATRTLTPPPSPSLTPTRTPTQGVTGPSCLAFISLTGTITAPFTQDGAGTFCWQSTNLGSYVNSWNLTSLSINGVNYTNVYVASGSYPAKVNGYWYVSYNSTVSYGHFEAK